MARTLSPSPFQILKLFSKIRSISLGIARKSSGGSNSIDNSDEQLLSICASLAKSESALRFSHRALRPCAFDSSIGPSIHHQSTDFSLAPVMVFFSGEQTPLFLLYVLLFLQREVIAPLSPSPMCPSPLPLPLPPPAP
jgi:hypothetical protein